jgi:S1-C subfamily serine protease
METTLAGLSRELADAVARAGRSVVTVHGRPRMTSSGVHWRPGIIVTAEHTIRRDDEIALTLPDGSTKPATLAGRDPGTDLAVLRAEGLDFPITETNAAESLSVGHLILAIGRGAESGVSATLGVVSALSGPWRTWRGGALDRYIRLDATLYPGSSGGAIVDTDGRAIGIGTSALSRLAGLAIPVSTVHRVVEELLTKGHISRGYLGVGLQPVPLPDHLRRQLSLEAKAGLMVLSVEENGPAARAGLLLGDLMIALDGKPVSDTDDLQAALGTDSVGKTVRASVIRGGSPVEIAMTVGERPRKEN